MSAVTEQFEALSLTFSRGTSTIYLATRSRWLSQSRTAGAICTHSYDDILEKCSLQKQFSFSDVLRTKSVGLYALLFEGLWIRQ